MKAAGELTLLFAVVTVLNLLKGGPEAGGGPLGLQSCGKACFWVTEILIFVIIYHESMSITFLLELLYRIRRAELLNGKIELLRFRKFFYFQVYNL